MHPTQNERGRRQMVEVAPASFELGLSEAEAERLARVLTDMERTYRDEDDAQSVKAWRTEWDEEAAYDTRLEWLYTSVDAHEVTVGEFHIDAYPVTNAQWAAYIEAVGKAAPATWDRKPDGWEAHFVTGVSPDEADAYAAHYGLSLPTEAEWERASRDGRQFFPWGDEYFPNGRTAFQAPVKSTYAVGSRPELASWCGVHDLVGQFGEFTSSTFEPYPGTSVALLDKHFHGQWKGLRVARGGYDVFQDATCVFRRPIPAERAARLKKFRCVERS
jgi:formylglycine-generating enzyme required for sulfatase activity